MNSFASYFSENGFITWNVEYRRVEHEGGGYPGTIDDVVEAYKYIFNLAEKHPIDTERIYIAGHSAGGHLALLLGSRVPENLPSPFKIVSLAGVADLRVFNESSIYTDAGLIFVEYDESKLSAGNPTE